MWFCSGLDVVSRSEVVNTALDCCSDILLEYNIDILIKYNNGRKLMSRTRKVCLLGSEVRTRRMVNFQLNT